MAASSLLALAGILAALAARALADQGARWRHWRVGRWGILLRLGRPGERCLSCHTEYVTRPPKRRGYVLAHPIRYTGETRETARAIVPLCQRCWLESPQQDRLRYAGEILNRWRQAGAYGVGDGFDQDAWDDHRFEIYSAVKGGL